MNLTCFKAYDIRGKLGEELNADIVYRIGRAYAVFLKPQSVVVGGDVRLTSNELKIAFSMACVMKVLMLLILVCVELKKFILQLVI